MSLLDSCNTQGAGLFSVEDTPSTGLFVELNWTILDAIQFGVQFAAGLH